MNDWLDFFLSSRCLPVIYLWSYSQTLELFLQNSYRVLHRVEKRESKKNGTA